MTWLSNLWRFPGKLWSGMMASGSLSLWLTAGAGMSWTLISIGGALLFRPLLTSDQVFVLLIVSLAIVAGTIAAMAGQEISLGISRGGVNLNVGRDPDPAPVPPETKRSLEEPA